MSEAATQQHRDGKIVMPFYIVLDQSGSMTGDFPALQRALEGVVHAITADFVAADYVMLSIIGFGSQARTLVPLSRAEDITVPTLQNLGGTTYSTAFQEFKRSFEQDRGRLKAEGSRVFRPCMFFLTDGEPTEADWEGKFQSLLSYDPRTNTGYRAYPFVVAYGFRDANPDTLKKLAYPNFGEKMGRWFLARDTDIESVFADISGQIAMSVVSSGQTAGSTAASPAGVPELVLPEVKPQTPTSLAGLPDELD